MVKKEAKWKVKLSNIMEINMEDRESRPLTLQITIKIITQIESQTKSQKTACIEHA